MRFTEILVLITLITGLIWGYGKAIKKIKIANNQHYKTPSWVDYLGSFFPVLFMVLLLRSFLFEPFRIPSGSMRPTLLEGDFILVNKFSYGIKMPITLDKIFSVSEPKVGDVVVFQHGDIDMIKRVVGVAGDSISYKNKSLYVNDKLVKQNFVSEVKESVGTNATSSFLKFQVDLGVKHLIQLNAYVPSIEYPYNNFKVPEGKVVVLGDNRDLSHDSRYWGMLDVNKILGPAKMIWFSADFSNFKVRWSRIGKKL